MVIVEVVVDAVCDGRCSTSVVTDRSGGENDERLGNRFETLRAKRFDSFNLLSLRYPEIGFGNLIFEESF